MNAFASAAEVAGKIADGKLKALDILDLYISRIELFDPQLNAVVVRDFERARSRAAEADAAFARGEVWGPLHGVPVTVKESFDVAGLPTTWGVPGLRGNVAASNSAMVQSLVDAGAIVMGKTNVPYMISDWQTVNEIYGATSNPWDTARTPGGSSGGSAAAVAAGLTGFDIGSDIGGSIRNPAHYCGLFSHKPSFGVVPQAGHAPKAGLPPQDMLVCGPLARSAEDLALALEVIAGPEPEDRAGFRVDLPAPRKNVLSDYRVAVMLESPLCAVDKGVSDVLSAYVGKLAGAGVTVDETAWPDIDFQRAQTLFMTLLRAATGAAATAGEFETLAADAARLAPDDDSYEARMLRASVMSHREWFALHEERKRIRDAWAAFFADYDLLLCPIAVTTAYLHDPLTPRYARKVNVNGTPQSFRDQFLWAGFASLAYLPATIAPAGLAHDGLPVGIQIIGANLRDRETIDFARLAAKYAGGATPPPAFAG